MKIRRIHCCEYKQSAPRINGKKEETRYLNWKKRTMNLKQKKEEEEWAEINEVLKLTLHSKCNKNCNFWRDQILCDHDLRCDFVTSFWSFLMILLLLIFDISFSFDRMMVYECSLKTCIDELVWWLLLLLLLKKRQTWLKLKIRNQDYFFFHGYCSQIKIE